MPARGPHTLGLRSYLTVKHMALFRKKAEMPAAKDALPGRSAPLAVPETHFVNGRRIVAPFPAGLAEAVFGLGCFWGAEKLFWQLPGVYSTAVGLRRRVHTQSDLRRGVLRPHGPCRSRARDLRSESRFLRGPVAGFLGVARSHSGDAPGQ